MFDVFVSTVIFLVISIFLILSPQRRNLPKKFPPGPPGSFLVGNYLQLGPARHLKFIEWGKKYGPILGLKLGSKPVVVLNDYRHIREAFNEWPFNGRPLHAILNVKDRNFGGYRGVTFNEGPHWLEQRRFTLRHLRDLGFGKSSIEDYIMPEISELIAHLVHSVGQPITTRGLFNPAVLNGLWSICCGDRFDQSDPILRDILGALGTLMLTPTRLTKWGQFFPQVQILEKLFPFWFPSQAKQFADKAHSLFQRAINDHKNNSKKIDQNYQGKGKDFVDAFLEKIHLTQDAKSSFYKEEGEKSLAVTILDLFVAANETVSSTLVWTCFLLSVHPHVQEKLHAAIFEHVGQSRPVSLHDRSNLTYLDATILEILRYSSLTPLGLAHQMTEDFENFHGFFIPKGTVVWANLFGAARDQSAWGRDADDFKPERFLSLEHNEAGAGDAGKNILIRNEAFLTFSTGRRVCPAEGLSKNELFLYIGNLVQRFQFRLAGPIDRQFGKETLIQNSPVPHEIILTDRFKL